jgi:hypothetical protein
MEAAWRVSRSVRSRKSLGRYGRLRTTLGQPSYRRFFLWCKAHTRIPTTIPAFVPTKDQTMNNHRSSIVWRQGRSWKARGIQHSSPTECHAVGFLLSGSLAHRASRVSFGGVYGVADIWTVGKTLALIRDCHWWLPRTPLGPSPSTLIHVSVSIGLKSLKDRSRATPATSSSPHLRFNPPASQAEDGGTRPRHGTGP